MEVRDIKETARRLEDAFRELEWRMDWLVLDDEAFEPTEIRAVAVELRLACMCHTSVVGEAVAAIRSPADRAARARLVWQTMQTVFDELVQLRIQLDRYEMSGRVSELIGAFSRFDSALGAFLVAEEDLFVEASTVRIAAR